MHANTCKVAVHSKGLIITLNIMHTVCNLRHTVAIITITFGYIFYNFLIGTVKPSLLRVPDGLRELFDSPCVRIDTKQIAVDVHGFKVVKVIPTRRSRYFQNS